MFKVGDTIKIPEQTITLKGDDGVFIINGYFFIPGSLKALGAVRVRKTYTERELDEKFIELNNVHSQNLALKALHIMQEDNSRPIVNCIYMAMGYKLENGIWYKAGEE